VGVFALTAFLVGCVLAFSAYVTLTLWAQNDAQVRCYEVRPESVVIEGNTYGTSYGFSLLPFGFTCTYWEPETLVVFHDMGTGRLYGGMLLAIAGIGAGALWLKTVTSSSTPRAIPAGSD
jgi:hypothetical protein